MKNEMKSLIDIMEERVKRTPDFVLYRFVTYEGMQASFQDCTIRQTYEQALAVARELKRKNVKKGDRAIIFSMQDFGTITAVFGCMMAGVVFTIIPPPLDEGKLDRFIAVLKSCKPKVLLSNYEMESESDVNITKPLIKRALREVIQLRRIYTDKLEPYKGREVIEPQNPEDLVYLQYTSGSTNAPKGVRVLRRNIMAQMRQCDHVYDFDHRKLGTWVPFFHNLGLVITILMPLCTEDTTIYHLSTLQFLENPKRWIKMLSDYKIELTVGPGSAFDACTKLFSKEEAAQYDLSHMTHLMNGSEFVSPKTIREFAELFHVPKDAAAPGYGLAENVCLASVASLDYRVVRLDDAEYQKNHIVLAEESDEHPKEIVGLGQPVKWMNVAIVNPKTKKAYHGLHIGEICIQGPSVADGYWGDIKDNKKFHYRIENMDGEFYRTGDLGFLHEGYLYITGRRKEMLIVNGHNVFPADLLLLLQHRVPQLAASAVGFFSVNDGRKEQVVACVEAPSKRGAAKISAAINEAVAKRFAFTFYDIIFVPEGAIPRTDNRKLKMLQAKELYQSGKMEILYSTKQAQILQNEMGEVAGEEAEHGKKHGAHLPLPGDLLIQDEIFYQVKNVFDKLHKKEQYSMTDSFLDLGGDSLTGFQLVSEIEQKFGINLDLREMLVDSSVMGVSNYVRSVLKGEGPRKKRVDLKKECYLDDEIQMDEEYAKPLHECNKIFLTGATGFLGSNFIKSMIHQYPKDGLKIYCHVRAEDKEAGFARIEKNMKHFGCWSPGFAEYIEAVPGDLSMPHLGIEEEEYERLSQEVEVIYHNGAMLNFVFPYEYLKRTNVNGTIEALRFAGHGKAKYFNYISSYSVFDNPEYYGKTAYESDPLMGGKGFALAYSETKWVSEKLVGIAQERGMKAIIFRPGDITGATNGVWNVEDMVSRVIVGCIQMRRVPLAPYSMLLTPVDYVSESICYIARNDKAIGQAFHIINPVKTPMMKLIRSIKRCGYTVYTIPFQLWRSMLKKSDSKENALSILECLFERGSDAQPGMIRRLSKKDTVFDTANTKKYLAGSGITCPEVDDAMIASYLKYFRKSGFIPNK